jgi:hypothetical protein
MAQQSMDSSPPHRFRVGRIAWWLLVVVSFALLLFLIVAEAMRFVTPSPPHRLKIEQEIPLPDALPDPTHRTSQHPFAAGQAQRFDHFDFQSFDPTTHLLFIVHTGPNPDKLAAVGSKVDAKDDGNIVVFDAQQNKVVGLVNVPQGSGILVVPELSKVFVSDAGDGIVYVIDEHSPFKIIDQIALEDTHDSPDAIAYDPVNHRIFVADPGTPLDPEKDANIDLKNQNVAVIDADADKLIGEIPFGLDKPFGDDVGHIQFDPGTNSILVVTMPLNDLRLNPPPEAKPSSLAVIDPDTLEIVSHIPLPETCHAAHGMVVDTDQHEAFIACIDSQNLVRVDLQTMQPFRDDADHPLSVAFNPDIVRLDQRLHLLFVACASGISIFDESGRGLKKVGDHDYFLGGGSHHTIAIDEATQLIYLPLPSVGGRPILRVMKYVKDGD